MSTELATIADKQQYSELISNSSLIPQAFRKKPADVLVAVEYGYALGLDPIVALSEINVISGTPSLSASLMASLARAAGHKVRVTTEGGAVTCTIIRSDDPDFEHTATWDEARAKKAGLWGKGHWQRDPQVMLQWRAIAACVRQACPEVLAGIRYTPDEAEEIASDRSNPVTVTQVPTEPTNPPQPPSSPAQDTPSRDWVADMERATTRDELKAIFDAGLPKALWGVMKEHKDRIEQATAAEVVQEQLGAEAIVDADIVEEQA